MKKLGIIFLPLIIMYSCNHDYVVKNTVNELEAIDSIKVEEISTEHSLLKPEHLIRIGERLICYDEKSDSNIFHMYSMPECEYISSFGTTGKGPNEIYRINRRIFGNYDEELFVIDGMRLKYINLADNKQGFQISRNVNISGRLFPLEAFTPINDSISFGCSNVNEKEYFTHNSESNTDNDIGEFANILNINNLGIEGYKTLNSQRVALKPDHTKIVSLYAMLPYIKIFDSNLQLENEAVLSNYESQNFELLENGGLRRLPSTEVYYLDIAVNDHYIYGLYIGKDRAYLRKSDNATGGVIPKLHIWNWDCELVAVVNLQTSICNIAVDKQGRYVMGVNPYVSNKIFRYDLRSIEL